jgi:hypothetical protein
MKKHTKREDEHSPLAILNEVSLEGTSSLVEAQRALLNLVQQENDIVMNGFKEQIAPFLPAVAVTDLLRRSLDTFIGMHQDFLTIASKHAISLFETGKTGKVDSSAHAFDLAREEAEVFARAQKKLLDVLSEETAKAMSGKRDQHDRPMKKAEWSNRAREAANAVIEAQKKLLDILGQQMNVNLDAATRAGDFLSPLRILPVAMSTGEKVKNFMNAESSLLGTMFKPSKGSKVVNHRSHGARQHKAA